MNRYLIRKRLPDTENDNSPDNVSKIQCKGKYYYIVTLTIIILITYILFFSYFY